MCYKCGQSSSFELFCFFDLSRKGIANPQDAFREFCFSIIEESPVAKFREALQTHPAEQAHELRELEDLFREEQVYESVLFNERLAILLTYDHSKAVFEKLSPRKQGIMTRKGPRLQMEYANKKLHSYSDRISQLQQRIGIIDIASDPEYYCLQRELMILKKETPDAEGQAALDEIDELLDLVSHEVSHLFLDIQDCYNRSDGFIEMILGDHQVHDRIDFSTPPSWKDKCNMKTLVEKERGLDDLYFDYCWS
ncbi:uncharacterized protein PAC_14881 [Phialocephala subalpina]|uniref:Uncharacterized protein n=1 Tax=Phialocephala subalpina TaxID=576137 RepID=A0A1L7XIX5_9HELO|nr:uncharacterized protein PAC_14881 [Phialocephala subalpina]